MPNIDFSILLRIGSTGAGLCETMGEWVAGGWKVGWAAGAVVGGVATAAITTAAVGGVFGFMATPIPGAAPIVAAAGMVLAIVPATVLAVRGASKVLDMEFNKVPVIVSPPDSEPLNCDDNQTGITPHFKFLFSTMTISLPKISAALLGCVCAPVGCLLGATYLLLGGLFKALTLVAKSCASVLQKAINNNPNNSHSPSVVPV